MANNERVSQLIELFATDLQSEDLFLVTDMSQRESKKMEMGQLLLFIESSGSFNAYSSVLAATASYVKASDVDGTVTSASFSDKSHLSDLATTATNATSASYALTASALSNNISSVATASFLQYSGFPNGTSSYALSAGSSVIATNTVNATNATNLVYTGVANGTASYAISSSVANTAKSASYVVNTQSASYSDYAVSAGSAGVASYASNGITSYSSVILSTPIISSGGSPTAPADVTGLSTTMTATATNSHFLINISIVIGNGSAGGNTSVGLWSSSSFNGLVPLIMKMGSLNGDDHDAITISATYIDTPIINAGDTITYKGVVYNPDGSYYVNRSKDNNYFGTSSMTVVEFVL